MLVLNRLGQEPRPVLLLLCSTSLGTCGCCVPRSQLRLLPAGRDLPLPGRYCGDLGFGSQGNFSFFNSFQLVLSLGNVKRASSPSLSIIFRPRFPRAHACFSTRGGQTPAATCSPGAQGLAAAPHKAICHRGEASELGEAQTFQALLSLARHRGPRGPRQLCPKLHAQL